MKVVLIAVLAIICSVCSSTIPTPAPVNYNKMVVDHLLSSKGKPKEASLVIAQQRSDSAQTPAEDRIFFPPYKFPFWGLPYGIYSNGGFFNPGLFPFVPGGPAFPPYDGIFGGPFGPGEFPGGGPTPFQGPKPNKTIPNYYGNAAGIQPFSPYPPFPLEAPSKKSNRKSNRIARSADDKEEWAATEQKGPTVLVMGGGGGGGYPSSYGMYGPSYSYAGSDVYMIKPPQAPAYGAQPYGYSSPQPYAAAPAMAYAPQSPSSPQSYAAAPAMSYAPQSPSSPQSYAAAPAMAYAPQPMSYPVPYGAPAMSYGPPMMGYGMPYQAPVYGASTPYMPPGGGYQMGPPNKPDDNKSEEKPKKTKKKKKKKKTKKVVYKYIREPCECETDCDDCECEETETSTMPDSTTTTAPPTTTAYTTTTTPAPNNPNHQPPPRYGQLMPHPRPSYQAPQYPGPPQYSPTPQPDHQAEGYYTPTETTAMIQTAEGSNQNAQYAESPYNSRQQPSRFNRNMRKRSPQRNYRPMTLPHNVPQQPRPRHAQRNPQYHQPVSVTLPKMPAPPQMAGLGIGHVPKLPRLPDIKSVPKMPSTATKGYAQQTMAGGGVQKQKAAAPTSVPELNLPELPDIPQIPVEFLGSQVPTSIYGQTEQEESPSFVVDDVQVADQYGVELLGNAVPQGFAGEDPYNHFELSSLESKTQQVELQPQREHQQPQREHQQPQREHQKAHRDYQQPHREYQQPQLEYQQPQREYQPPQREYQQPQREQQQPQQYHSPPSYQHSAPEHTEPGPGPHEQTFPVPITHEYSQLMHQYGQDSTQANQAHQTYQPQSGSYDPSQQYAPIQQNYQHHPSVTEYNADPNSLPPQYEVPQQQYSPPAPHFTSPQYAAVQQYGNAPQYHSPPEFNPQQQQVQQEMTSDSDHYTDNQDHAQSNTPAYYPADSSVDDVGVLDTGPLPLYGAQNDLSNSHSSPSLYPRPNYSGSFVMDSQSVPPETQLSDNQHNNYIPENTMPSSPSPQVNVPDCAAPSDFNHYVPVGSGSLQDIFSSVDSDRRLFAKRNLPPQDSLQETSKKSESISREDQDDSSLLTTFALENDKPENRSYRIGVYSTSNGGPSTSFAMVGPKNIMVYASTSKNNSSAPAGSTTGDPFNVQKLPGIPVDGPGNLVGMISGAPKSGSAALGFVEPVDQGEDYIDVDTKPSSRAGR